MTPFPGPGGTRWAIPWRIVMCESRGNFRALNRSSMAGGAYQAIPSTWRAYGGKGYAHNATPYRQHVIAGRILRGQGLRAWECA